MHSRQVCNSDDVAEMLTSTGPVACLPSASHICYKSCSVLKLNHFLTRISILINSSRNSTTFEVFPRQALTDIVTSTVNPINRPIWCLCESLLVVDPSLSCPYFADVCVNRCWKWIHPSCWNRFWWLCESLYELDLSLLCQLCELLALADLSLSSWTFSTSVWIAASSGSIPLFGKCAHVCENCCTMWINPSPQNLLMPNSSYLFREVY